VLTDTVPQTSSLNLTTWFTYNPSGTLWKVTDPRGSGPGDSNYTTTFQYNASDERVQMTYPNSNYRTWTYDDDHNLCHRRTVNSVRQDFGYDNLNRVISMQWANPNNVSNFASAWASYGYDNAGRLQTASNGTGAWSQNPISTIYRDYDPAGRLDLESQNVAGLGSTKNVSYSYRRDGTRKWLTVSGSYAHMWDYDDMARPEKITYSGNLTFQYDYDQASNET